ncbi:MULTISPECIES: hypothetical protein [Microbacterium]|uniref:hypothetical protein n=1 Tax=Microbacterium TaxID=33882 RepID=UPI00278A6E51|nr:MULTISPECIES: hypothetical protein [Microbacterium]MDQ1082839.1 hypothetical protein [Microbacterium sp. SORGH_AS_0344]MDQ1168392.1 hypothetical protein [Microbacterium proteolyticum]
MPHDHVAGVTRIYWRLRGLRDPAQVLLSIAVSACLTIAGTYGIPGVFEWPAVVWLIVGLVLGLLWVFGVFVWFKPTYADLERQKAAAEEKLSSERERSAEDVEAHRAALQGALDEILLQLHTYVCDQEVDTRVSVYSVEDDEFILVARCSSNPFLEQRGRSSYPLSQGAIGVAWAKKFVIENNEHADREAWEASLVSQGFTTAEAAALTMHSRSIYAERLDRDNRKTGVVVFECEEQDRFTSATLKKVQRSYLRETLAAVLSASHVYLPHVRDRHSQLADTQPAPPEPKWKSVSSQIVIRRSSTT